MLCILQVLPGLNDDASAPTSTAASHRIVVNGPLFFGSVSRFASAIAAEIAGLPPTAVVELDFKSSAIMDLTALQVWLPPLPCALCFRLNYH